MKAIDEKRRKFKLHGLVFTIADLSEIVDKLPEPKK